MNCHFGRMWRSNRTTASIIIKIFELQQMRKCHFGHSNLLCCCFPTKKGQGLIWICIFSLDIEENWADPHCIVLKANHDGGKFTVSHGKYFFSALGNFWMKVPNGWGQSNYANIKLRSIAPLVIVVTNKIAHCEMVVKCSKMRVHAFGYGNQAKKRVFDAHLPSKRLVDQQNQEWFFMAN